MHDSSLAVLDQEFVRAVVAFQKRLLSRKEKGARKVGNVLELQRETVEKQRQKIVRSFSIAKHIYDEQVQVRKNPSVHNGGLALQAIQAETKQSNKELEFGAQFLQVCGFDSSQSLDSLFLSFLTSSILQEPRLSDGSSAMQLTPLPLILSSFGCRRIRPSTLTNSNALCKWGPL